MSNITTNEGRKRRKNYKKQETKDKEPILNVEDVVEKMTELRKKLVKQRELPQKEEFKVVVTFDEIEKILRSSRPKQKKIDKKFNLLLKIFTTVKLSNARECIESIKTLKQGVDDIMSILCL